MHSSAASLHDFVAGFSTYGEIRELQQQICSQGDMAMVGVMAKLIEGGETPDHQIVDTVCQLYGRPMSDEVYRVLEAFQEGSTPNPLWTRTDEGFLALIGNGRSH